MVTKEPKPAQDKEHCFLFPKKAKEILANKSKIVTCFFFPPSKDPQITDDTTLEDYEKLIDQDDSIIRPEWKRLEQLIEFLDMDEEVNYLLAGYLNEIVKSFLEIKPKEIYEYFFFSPNFSSHLLNHLYCNSISNLLAHFLLLDVESDCEKSIKELFDEDKVEAINHKRVYLLRKVLDSFNISNDPEVIDNVRQIFHTYFENKETIQDFCNIFTSIFLDKESLDILFKFLLIGKVSFKTEAAANILSMALVTIKEPVENIEIKTYFEENLGHGNVLYQFIIDQADHIVKNLKSCVEEGSITMTSYSQETVCLGIHNLAVIDLLKNTLLLKNKGISMTIALSNFLTICIVSPL